jgi:hypothetical protein
MTRKRGLLLRVGCGMLVLASLVAGTLLDAWPARPAEMRAGYRVLQADLHAHTRFSDGVLSPFDLVLLGRRRGLDVVAVTEHNTVFPAKLARAYAAVVDDAPIIVVGEEVTTLQLHMLALGIEQNVDPRLPPALVADAVHEQGGVVIVAHPTKRFWPALQPACDRLDGVETVHPLAFNERPTPIGSWPEIVELAEGPCAGPDKAHIGTSDYHAGNVLGILRTHVFVSEVSDRGVIEAIREGRTVAIAPDGRAFGRRELVSALEQQPLVERPADYEYRGNGALDRVTRMLGFCGALGLLLLGLKRRN